MYYVFFFFGPMAGEKNMLVIRNSLPNFLCCQDNFITSHFIIFITISIHFKQTYTTGSINDIILCISWHSRCNVYQIQTLITEIQVNIFYKHINSIFQCYRWLINQINKHCFYEWKWVVKYQLFCLYCLVFFISPIQDTYE